MGVHEDLLILLLQKVRANGQSDVLKRVLELTTTLLYAEEHPASAPDAQRNGPAALALPSVARARAVHPGTKTWYFLRSLVGMCSS